MPADPQQFLPLTPLSASILLAVAGGAHHGYAILKELEQRGGVRVPGAGSLYAALQRMHDEGLLEETDALDPDPEGPRRRCYVLTELARDVARLEMERLAEMVSLAAERRLVAEELLRPRGG